MDAIILPAPHLNTTFPGLCPFPSHFQLTFPISSKNITNKKTRNKLYPILSCSRSETSSSSSSSSSSSTRVILPNGAVPPRAKKRKRYRKLYPGETEGITEEMRFVAMRLRNRKGKKLSADDNQTDSENENSEVEKDDDDTESSSENESDANGETWQPSMDGFLKFLVDSKLVFHTVERIIDKADDVSYAYFRNTGLERSEGLSKDLEWFSQQDLVIPEPSNSGVSYATYLEAIAEKSAPLFLSHFYNINFSHIAGGQVIARRVSDQILEGRELAFYSWEGEAPELLKSVREKLNTLGEHWSRDERNKCLKEATKSFKFMGQIVRLIIL